MTKTEHVNVLIIGAGISGIGAAHHFKEQCPQKSFLILESKDTHGGTWATHTYPGIRSDSDLYTFGYRFKPWTGAPIADGHLINDYIGEVIKDDGLESHIRYGHEVIKASWSDATQVWTVIVNRLDTNEEVEFSCNFFFWTGGYYDHKQGYTPEWPGLDRFEGTIVHPQTWPDDLDLSGKKVVVIGSGATAATLIPNIADDCAHVTMLQRSPTYFWTGENRNELADRLRMLKLPEEWVHETVRRDLLHTAKEIQYTAAEQPELVKEELLKVVRGFVGDEVAEKHFMPSYRPWQQRLAFVPDGDLFHAVNSGKASIVTDQIEAFTEKGIMLKSGEALEADVIITATGFNLLAMGGVGFEVNGKSVDLADTYTYRGILLSGLPNLAMMFGYLRTSWTMRVDLVCDYLCRLINHMDKKGAKVVTPTLREQDRNMPKNRWISEQEFNPGYFNRRHHLMPKSGDREPWVFSPDYYTEKDQLPNFDLDDDTLIYTR
ncbi:NAD(P)/FAD-dependent oxidoreductase [Pseudomaricurvus alkylphenolicus]|uniref:flavin-containing monooxygenase n=1 Tax=Pseudomaricurvus alkylphenolicus TaxID=1306991 RepID=UPI001422F4F3|nr:NAD(P)/FAD-dependent oxidoreductase [Pseudomaricurvus alkylphenolicus]NIB42406.1 NAD(P)/FAD-dependent oxidoreductase [Pseudomaricurvus alkylphenolicus]